MEHFLGEYMCLSIPSKIKSINKEMNSCIVDTMGVERSASLDLIDKDVVVGDYVLIHIGFAMNKIDEEDALESLKVYKEIIDKMDELDRQQAIEEAENCPNR
jgi:hydrogenase expression/formation protein HypC